MIIIEKDNESNSEGSNSVAIRHSAKKPLPQKRKSSESQERILHEQPVYVVHSHKDKRDDAEDIFGQHVAAGLRAVSNIRSRELAKLKIQEILFQAQFGVPGIPTQQTEINFHIQPSPDTQSHERDDKSPPDVSFCTPSV